MFERDCDEMKSWINEKLKSAHDDSYMDATNLQVCEGGMFFRDPLSYHAMKTRRVPTKY